MAKTNNIDNLYTTLVNKGLYTKSKDDFILKYSSDEEIDKLYGVLTRDGLYTKTKEEFLSKYPLKKKDISQPDLEEPLSLGTTPCQWLFVYCLNVVLWQ